MMEIHCSVSVLRKTYLSLMLYKFAKEGLFRQLYKTFSILVKQMFYFAGTRSVVIYLSQREKRL